MPGQRQQPSFVVGSDGSGRVSFGALPSGLRMHMINADVPSRHPCFVVSGVSKTRRMINRGGAAARAAGGGDGVEEGRREEEEEEEEGNDDDEGNEQEEEADGDRDGADADDGTPTGMRGIPDAVLDRIVQERIDSAEIRLVVLARSLMSPCMEFRGAPTSDSPATIGDDGGDDDAPPHFSEAEFKQRVEERIRQACRHVPMDVRGVVVPVCIPQVSTMETGARDSSMVFSVCLSDTLPGMQDASFNSVMVHGVFKWIAEYNMAFISSAMSDGVHRHAIVVPLDFEPTAICASQYVARRGRGGKDSASGIAEFFRRRICEIDDDNDDNDEGGATPRAAPAGTRMSIDIFLNQEGGAWRGVGDAVRHGGVAHVFIATAMMDACVACFANPWWKVDDGPAAGAGCSRLLKCDLCNRHGVTTLYCSRQCQLRHWRRNIVAMATTPPRSPEGEEEKDEAGRVVAAEGLPTPSKWLRSTPSPKKEAAAPRRRRSRAAVAAKPAAARPVEFWVGSHRCLCVGRDPEFARRKLEAKHVRRVVVEERGGGAGGGAGRK